MNNKKSGGHQKTLHLLNLFDEMQNRIYQLDTEVVEIGELMNVLLDKMERLRKLVWVLEEDVHEFKKVSEGESNVG